MAKQRRSTRKPAAPKRGRREKPSARAAASSRSSARKSKSQPPRARPATKRIKTATKGATKPATKTVAKAKAPLPKAEPAQPRRPNYLEALALYERGIEALQRHDFNRSAELLRTVLDRYPEERELHDRARLYLRVCERHAQPQPPAPKTVDERVYAATVHLNAGNVQGALEQLQAAASQAPDHDHVQYMLAVAHAARGDQPRSVDYLRRAIELNPENRSLARQEPELDSLRDNDGFRQLLDTHGSSRRRSRGRSRSAG